VSIRKTIEICNHFATKFARNLTVQNNRVVEMGLTKEPSLSMTTSSVSVAGCGHTSDSSETQNYPKIFRRSATKQQKGESPLTTEPSLGLNISSRDSSTTTMDYNWLTSAGDHDPITIDANLAEIDFDDFKNEDIQNAYAYSLQSYDDASSSGTDMSICRSEALFSSYKDMPGQVGTSESLIQDSLTAEDFQWSPGLALVNKNNYTLTFSGHGSISSHVEFGSSPYQHHQPPKDESSNTERLTTWSNMVKQQRVAGAGDTKDMQIGVQGCPGDNRGRSRTREENNINNNMDSSRKSRSLPNICKDKPLIKHAWKASDEEEEKFQREILSEEPNLIKLYLQQRGDRNSWNGVSRASDVSDSNEASYSEEEITNKDNDLSKIPSMKNKDAVNNFLKTASKLTSIEENSEMSSGSEPTMRPIPTPRQRSMSSRSSMSTSPSVQSQSSGAQTKRNSRAGSDLPTLDFLENDVGLWDAFFMHSKNSAKFTSVLKPSLPVDEYLQDHVRRGGGGGKPEIRDLNSLRVLLPSSQKHLITETDQSDNAKNSPIRQICSSLSQLNSLNTSHCHKQQTDEHNLKVQVAGAGGTRVQVKEGWVPGPETVKGVVPDWESYQKKQAVKLRPRTAAATAVSASEAADKNLNLINNNKTTSSRDASESEQIKEKASKRRSYHPQDFLSKILTSPADENAFRQLKRSAGFPKSGSQGNLCDSWAEDGGHGASPSPGSASPGGLSSFERRSTSKVSTSRIRAMPAEYPFQANLSMPQSSVNFDLTHKRGLFVSLYSAVERLLLYQDSTNPAYSSKAACRCILLHEFCPALHRLLEDGIKEEVITSFGRMKTSVWRLIEAVIQAGPAQRNTCDLVMLLNTKFSSEEDFKKFSGFVIGLLNMSSLHIWFSKLKWSLDVLLRFYERHAFICALHKETKLLFDELIFCLQRLYCVPFHLDMPFNDSILEEITTVEVYKRRDHCQNCACTRTPTSGSEGSSWFTGTGQSTPGSEASRAESAESGRSSRSGKSRIPRPISLPKRLEDKLSIRASRSPLRASSAGHTTVNAKTTSTRPPLKSPIKPQVRR